MYSIYIIYIIYYPRLPYVAAQVNMCVCPSYVCVLLYQSSVIVLLNASFVYSVICKEPADWENIYYIQVLSSFFIFHIYWFMLWGGGQWWSPVIQVSTQKRSPVIKEDPPSHIVYTHVGNGHPYQTQGWTMWIF